MNGKSKAHVFLMEIIIAILFFSIAAAVTLQLFVRARQQSQDSVDLNTAVIKTQNIAEVFKASDSVGENWVSFCEENFVRDGEDYTAYYNEDWFPSKDATERYVQVEIKREAQTGGTMITADISCVKNENILYSLQIKRYLLNQ